ncbi:MAG: MoaD/ThiS family protein [Planctomycetota bacterium]|jgi:sulfur carrier protein ThiS
MVVEVKLFATFTKGRFKKKQMELPEGTSLKDLFKQLNIPAKEVGILLVNGQGAVHKQKLCSHDVVSIFPLIAGG